MVNLVNVPNVELMKTGTWNISTGEWDVTPELIQAAIQAHESGVLRKPVIRIGHNDPRFTGDPAVGFIDNVRASEDGSTLYGDLMGVPKWLADIMPSAYSDRSIEGMYDYRAPDGSEHPFVLTGLALLGATAPGVSSLKSLQDVAKLYDADIAAAVGEIGGKPIEFQIRTPIPQDDEVQAASAAPEKGEAVMASLKEQLAQRLGIESDADEADFLKAIDEKFGSTEEKDEAKAEEPKVEAEAQPELVAASAPNMVQLSRDQYDTIMAAASEVQKIRAEQAAEARERLVMAAVEDGRITPASRQDWLRALEVDPGGHNKTALASLAKGLVPVSEIGHAIASEATDSDQADMERMFAIVTGQPIRKDA